MTEMSRRPASDICSVRGIGVADSVSTSTLSLQLAQQLLLLDAEALLLVHDQQAEVLRAHVAREQPVGADQDVDLALGEGRRPPRASPSASGSATTISIRNG